MREHAWTAIATRHHDVHRVYTAKDDFSDIFFLGTLTAKFRNGCTVAQEFVSRTVFDPDSLKAGKAKAKYYQVWNVSVAMMTSLYEFPGPYLIFACL